MHTKIKLLSGVMLAGLLSLPVLGQIYNWQTGEVIPGTEGITVGPGMVIGDVDLGYADFSGGLDLTGSSFYQLNLRNARFNNANLTHVLFFFAYLKGADFTDANITGVNLQHATPYFTASQLYSTASYKAGDLRDINLFENNLTDWDFTNQNIQGVNFGDTTGFTSAQLYSTSSYQAKNLSRVVLSGLDLTGWEFSDQNITGARFSNSNLTAAQLYSTASYQVGNLQDVQLFGIDVSSWDFTDQLINGAIFGGDINNFSPAQLYATASYKAGDLRGFGLPVTGIDGWNFSNQDLSEATFESAIFSNNNNFTGATLARANFSQAHILATDMSGVDFSGAVFDGASFSGTNLSGANLANSVVQYFVNMNTVNLSGADTRGAEYLSEKLPFQTTNNTIFPDGHIAGLSLADESTLRIRDYENGIAITIQDQFQMAGFGVLEVIFEDADWGSTINLDLPNGVQTELDGALHLLLKDDLTYTQRDALVGTTFQVFNWNGQLASGDTFAHIAMDPGFAWDVSDLYVGGTVTLLSVPIAGDCDVDGDIDYADLEAGLACLDGPEVKPVIGCGCLDLESDRDIDVADVSLLQQDFTGSNP